MFTTYLQLGFDHILDIEGFDHILFVVALCAVYRISQWKQVLILVTAFTIGHSITLALAGMELVSISPEIIEFLIPFTILLTALFNVWKGSVTSKHIKWNYFLALFFGLIHGLGFSNFFRALISKEDNIISMLFPFNIGVEIGQIVIVFITMFCSYLVIDIFRKDQRDWNLFVSGGAAFVALTLILG